MMTEAETLRMEIADLKAWQQVAVDSNKALDAYLREVDPSLPEHYGMPVDGVRAIMDRLRAYEPVPVTGERFWECKLGPAPANVPDGGDSPLRIAAQEAFYSMFAKYPVSTFSGWGGHLTRDQREVKGDQASTTERREA